MLDGIMGRYQQYVSDIFSYLKQLDQIQSYEVELPSGRRVKTQTIVNGRIIPEGCDYFSSETLDEAIMKTKDYIKGLKGNHIWVRMLPEMRYSYSATGSGYAIGMRLAWMPQEEYEKEVKTDGNTEKET